MFKITLSPQFSDAQLKLEKSGHVLRVNDMPYDFSALNDGDEIPEEAIANEYVLGSITKSDGVVNITVLMPYSDADAPNGVLFPDPIMIVEDGEITFNEKVVADD